MVVHKWRRNKPGIGLRRSFRTNHSYSTSGNLLQQVWGREEQRLVMAGFLLRLGCSGGVGSDWCMMLYLSSRIWLGVFCFRDPWEDQELDLELTLIINYSEIKHSMLSSKYSANLRNRMMEFVEEIMKAPQKRKFWNFKKDCPFWLTANREILMAACNLRL